MRAAAVYGLALRYAADLPPAEHAQLLEQSARECHMIDQRGTALRWQRELTRPATLQRHVVNVCKVDSRGLH